MPHRNSTLKPRRCKVCGTEYRPRSSTQKVCAMQCAVVFTNKKAEEREIRRARAKRELLKTPTEVAAGTQAVFNRYIRIRDKHKPCISCGQSPYIGARHASHYRSRKAASQLRFNLFNTAASCAQCNSFKSGNVVEYRIELVRRIGEDRVRALEWNQDKVRYTNEYLERLRKVFKRKADLYERLFR